VADIIGGNLKSPIPIGWRKIPFMNFGLLEAAKYRKYQIRYFVISTDSYVDPT
jgi:hypothetical protein